MMSELYKTSKTMEYSNNFKLFSFDMKFQKESVLIVFILVFKNETVG